jgi:osmoprotectant transport system ATP-binding protein
MRPADDFVADFVGADRALKRLALARAGEMALQPPPAPGDADGEVRVAARASVREALSAMLAAGAGDALVVGDDGRPSGLLTVDAIGGMLAAERRGEHVT